MTASRPFFRRLLLCALAAPLLHCSGSTGGDPAPGPAGTGSASDPYRVATLDDLRWLSEDSTVWGAHFVQVADIDARSTAGWNNDSGFRPIGAGAGLGFRGTYNGKGHTITGLTINRPWMENLGFFALISSGSVVESLALLDASVRCGEECGTFAGINHGTIRSCRASGKIDAFASGDAKVGGLVGHNREDVRGFEAGGVQSCQAAVTVDAFDVDWVGGLVGMNEGRIVSSSSSGRVTGRIGVGGLIGTNFRGRIRFVHASGAVSGVRAVGGLVGSITANGIVDSAFATGSVSGWMNVGGFAGTLYEGQVSHCYATGTVVGRPAPLGYEGDWWQFREKSSAVGGLIGYHLSLSYGLPTIQNSFATGAVSGDSAVGGLVGFSVGGISRSYSTGRVTGAVQAGGLAGHSSAVESSYWDVETSGILYGIGSKRDSSAAGGLATPAMRIRGSYVGWDFDKNWAIDEGAGTPWLRALGRPASPIPPP